MGMKMRHRGEAEALCRQFYAALRRDLEAGRSRAVEEGDAAAAARIGASLDGAMRRGQPRKGTVLADEVASLKAIGEAAASADAARIVVVVTYRSVRSRGYVPSAWVCAVLRDGTRVQARAPAPAASGGYDLVSHAVSRAMSRIPAVTRLVIQAGPGAWDHYAVGRCPYPRLAFAGKGLGTLRSWMEDRLGWRCLPLTTGTVDVYWFEPKRGGRNG